MIYYANIDSPINELLLVSDGDSLCGLYMQPAAAKQNHAIEGKSDSCLGIFKNTMLQLEEYFQGERFQFEIPLSMQGREFQLAVWQELRKIPYGSSRTYGELAKQLGNPNASRAVGAANGRNPISIIVPCHRVIGQNGSLTGFSGGLQRKQYLLSLESKCKLENRFLLSEPSLAGVGSGAG